MQRSYSQNDEQDYILRSTAHIPPAQGCFLDIGAYDGYTYSNTMALVELGWSGVMVEPALGACADLLNRHGQNPRVTIVHGVVALQRGLTKFWNDPTTYSSTIDGHQGRRRAPGYWTPTITFDELLPSCGVDVLSIDTEGTSLELLKGFPWARYCPRCVCVEHDERQNEVAVFMKTRPGTVYNCICSNGVNMIFERNP